jgi:hypothetical protein
MPIETRSVKKKREQVEERPSLEDNSGSNSSVRLVGLCRNLAYGQNQNPTLSSTSNSSSGGGNNKKKRRNNKKNNKKNYIAKQQREEENNENVLRESGKLIGLQGQSQEQAQAQNNPVKDMNAKEEVNCAIRSEEEQKDGESAAANSTDSMLLPTNGTPVSRMKGQKKAALPESSPLAKEFASLAEELESDRKRTEPAYMARIETTAPRGILKELEDLPGLMQSSSTDSLSPIHAKKYFWKTSSWIIATMAVATVAFSIWVVTTRYVDDDGDASSDNAHGVPEEGPIQQTLSTTRRIGMAFTKSKLASKIENLLAGAVLTTGERFVNKDN